MRYCFFEIEDAGGITFDAHLLFNRSDGDAIAVREPSVARIDVLFRDKEKIYRRKIVDKFAFGIWQFCKNKMYNVVGKIVISAGDEDGNVSLIALEDSSSNLHALEIETKARQTLAISRFVTSGFADRSFPSPRDEMHPGTLQ